MASIMEDYMFWLREDSSYVVCLAVVVWVGYGSCSLWVNDDCCQHRVARATVDYLPRDRSLLSFHKGEIITIVSRDASGWWKGKIEGKPSADIMCHQRH